MGDDLGGRPTKYLPGTVKKILAALKNGATRKDAAACAGIHYDTFNEWAKEFSEFSVSVEQAEAEPANLAAARIVAELRNADGDWRSAESFLKRRRRSEWGDNVNVNLDADIEGLLAQLGGTGENKAS